MLLCSKLLPVCLALITLQYSIQICLPASSFCCCHIMGASLIHMQIMQFLVWWWLTRVNLTNVSDRKALKAFRSIFCRLAVKAVDKNQTTGKSPLRLTPLSFCGDWCPYHEQIVYKTGESFLCTKSTTAIIAVHLNMPDWKHGSLIISHGSATISVEGTDWNAMSL